MATARKDATGNQYRGGCARIVRNVSQLNMWRQRARPNGAKKNQRSRISHPPTRRDGHT
jgi:hypothetical protein